MVQSVFFVNELFATATAFDNGSAVYSPCMTDQIGVIFEFFVAVLTDVFVATKQTQSNYLLDLAIKDF